MRSTCLPERSKPLLLPTQVVSTSATWTQPLFMRESRRPAFHAYPEAPGSRTVKIGSPEQPDIAQFPAFLRSRHSRLHRVVLMDSHERGNLKRLRGASRSRPTNTQH